MPLIVLIWNGIGGLGAGTVILKAVFILVLGAIVWMLCELAKFTVQVLAKLSVDAFRSIAIMVRGWPRKGEDGEEGDGSGETVLRKLR
jgi:O-antigen/teichoic acid export membrane protein